MPQLAESEPEGGTLRPRGRTKTPDTARGKIEATLFNRDAGAANWARKRQRAPGTSSILTFPVANLECRALKPNAPLAKRSGPGFQ